MAGPWIKVEAQTLDKPEVLRIARAVGIERDAALGKLIRVWVWFDANSVDGVVDGAVDEDVDALVSTPGFAKAMRGVDWLASGGSGTGLQATRFDRHNGDTAKNRAMKTERQARYRRVDGDVDAAPSTHLSLSLSSSFVLFWDAWPSGPRKGSKSQCWDLWRKRNYDVESQAILAHVTAMSASNDWRKDGGAFVPSPKVYLNQRRWDGADAATVRSRFPGAL